MKKTIAISVLVVFSLAACAKKQIKPEAAVYGPHGTKRAYSTSTQEAPREFNIKIGKGFVPTDPFPPIPPEAKVYVAVGRSPFKKDLQTAMDLARISAFGQIIEQLSVSAKALIEAELRDATAEMEGDRLLKMLSQYKYEGPFPGRKFAESVISKETGEVITRVYVSRHEADRFTVPIYVQWLLTTQDMGYAKELDDHFLRRYRDSTYMREEERQLRILREYHNRVVEELQKRIN